MENSELTLEIPGGVTQQDLWDLEVELSKAEGITEVSLSEPKDFGASALLVIVLIPVAAKYVKQGMETTANIQAAAKLLHGFLHPKDKKSEKDEAARKKVIFKQADGTPVELYGYSVEEIEQLFAKSLPEGKK